MDEEEFLEMFNQVRTIRSRVEAIEAAQIQLVEDNAVTHDLLRLLARPTLREDLLQLLKSSSSRRAYEHSDGRRTSRQVAELAGASLGSISNWWRRWTEAGLAVPVGGGRVRHLLPLTTLGIPLEVKR